MERSRTDDEKALAEILHRCREGDEKGWLELYNIFRPRILWVARRWRLDGYDPEDIVQESFIKIVGAIDRLDDGNSVPTYINQVAHVTCIDFVRRNTALKRGGESTTASLDELHEAGFEPSLDVEESGEEIDGRVALLKDCIATLSETERNLIELRYGLGMEIQEIAKQLGERPNTVAVRTHRALKKLRSRVENETAVPGEVA